MKEEKRPSVLTQLRDMTPRRGLTPSEARQVLERQATRLLKLTGVVGPPVPIEDIIAGLPRIEYRRHSSLPASGRTQWAGRSWVILVDSSEPSVRQRYSLGHELAHVVYHPLSDIALPAYKDQTAEARLEWACEYFAACLLMPRTWLKRAYYDEGIQGVPALGHLFSVSWVALRIRLEQLGLEAVHERVRSAA